MTIVGLHHAAIRVTSASEAASRLTRLGLPLLELSDHPVTSAPAAVLGTGSHRLVLAEDPDGKLSPRTPLDPFAYVALRAAPGGDWPAQGWASGSGLFGDSYWLDLPTCNSMVELVELDLTSEVGDTGIWRIESIPWSVIDRTAAEEEAAKVLGLRRSIEYSDLLFPDLQSKNALLFLGDESYIDFNEPTDAASPTARRLAARGNGVFALVLEPQDFDKAVAELHQRDVPTVTPDPVNLRVVWRDGSEGSAARIISIDKEFTFGARIFVSEPTFPW